MAMSRQRRIKHERVVEYLRGAALDAVLLSRRCNFSWYTCGAHNYVANTCDVGNSHLLVRRDGACVLTNNIEAARLDQEELAGSGIEIVTFAYHDPAEPARTFHEALGSMCLAVDAPVPGVDAPALGPDFDRLRWTLTEDEIRQYRDLCNDTVSALEASARSAEPGMTENQLAGVLAGKLRSKDCLPWVILVAGDDRVEKFRHPLPTAKTVKDYFMLVVCAERAGLIANHTRIASFAPIPDELAGKHEAVAVVDTALITATRVGATLGDVFAQGQEAYAAGGFADQWQLHHQGGSCGYLPREVLGGPGERTAALADQAFAWNPSITGTKSEDTILCTKDGPKVLADLTDWPTIEGAWKGQTLPRPAILIL